MLWDAVHFYDRFSHKKLVRRAICENAPLRLLRVCLQAYRAPRYVSMVGRAVGAIQPNRSIVAGGCFSDVWVKVYTKDGLELLTKGCPEFSFERYVDDLQISARLPEKTIVETMRVAANQAEKWIKEDLEAEISAKKAATVASCPRVRAAIRKALGETGGQSTKVAKNLGIDYAVGLTRGRLGNKTSRKKRAKKAASRAGKFARISLADRKSKARKLFISGLRLAIGYGSEITGLSNSELVVAENLALKTLRPTARGRSRQATLLLGGNPSANLASASLVRWAKEVWKAACSPNGFPGMHNSGLPTLRIAWQSVAETGATESRSWRSCRGPISAAMLALKRLGWKVSSPFAWELPN